MKGYKEFFIIFIFGILATLLAIILTYILFKVVPKDIFILCIIPFGFFILLCVLCVFYCILGSFIIIIDSLGFNSKKVNEFKVNKDDDFHTKITTDFWAHHQEQQTKFNIAQRTGDWGGGQGG